MSEPIPWPSDRPIMNVPEAGRLAYGLSRTRAYEAAARGDLPTVRVNGRLYVPTAPLRAQLGLPIERDDERGSTPARRPTADPFADASRRGGGRRA